MVFWETWNLNFLTVYPSNIAVFTHWVVTEHDFELSHCNNHIKRQLYPQVVRRNLNFIIWWPGLLSIVPRVDFWAGRHRPPLGRSPNTNGEAFREVINFPDFSRAFATQFETFPIFCTPSTHTLQLSWFLPQLWYTTYNSTDKFTYN